MSRHFSRFRGFVTKQPLNRVEETGTKTRERISCTYNLRGEELRYDEPRDPANFSPSLQVKLLHTKRPLLLPDTSRQKS